MKKNIIVSYIMVLSILLQACGGDSSTKADNSSSGSSDVLSQNYGLKYIYRHSTLAAPLWNPLSGFMGVGYSYREENIALFEDGTYSNNIEDMIQGRAKPKSKGKWRLKDNDLELAEGDSDTFDSTRWSYPIYPGDINQKLNGCFIRNRGGQTVYTDVAKYFCFNSNGSYAYIVRGGNTTKGIYEINGYTMELTNDHNGSTNKVLFAFIQKKKEDITFRDVRYNLTTKKISDLEEIKTEAHKGKKLIIVNKAPNQKDICEYARSSYEKAGLKDISIEEITDMVTCKDYNLIENGKECKIHTYKGKYKGNKICLVWHSGK